MIMDKKEKDSGNGQDNEILSAFEKMKKNLSEEKRIKKSSSKKKITEELEIEELVSEIGVLRKELEDCKNIEDDSRRLSGTMHDVFSR